MELLLKIIAVALLGAAVYFYSAGDQDWLFATAVLAACSFFLSLRFRIKKRIDDGRSTESADGTKDG